MARETRQMIQRDGKHDTRVDMAGRQDAKQELEQARTYRSGLNRTRPTRVRAIDIEINKKKRFVIDSMTSLFRL